MTEFTHTVTPDEAGRPIRDILRRNFHFSSRLMTKLKAGDLILLNGEPMPGWVPAAAGDRITARMPQETSDIAPEPIPLDILYEDAYLLVLNKQAGVAVHPTKNKPYHTIANGVMQKMLTDMEKGSDPAAPYKIRFVNRLDMNTSGLLLVAKTGYVQEEIIRQMRAKEVEKKYLAVVTGVVSEEEGVIDLPLGHPYEDEIERWVVPEQKGGVSAVTRYRTLRRFREHTLLELSLETGRTHQIRIHLSYIGYPIVGDHLYGHGDPFLYRKLHNIPKDVHEEHISPYIDRQALHAYELTFRHPVSGARMTFRAPLPQDMRDLLATVAAL